MEKKPEIEKPEIEKLDRSAIVKFIDNINKLSEPPKEEIERTIEHHGSSYKITLPPVQNPDEIYQRIVVPFLNGQVVLFKNLHEFSYLLNELFKINQPLNAEQIIKFVKGENTNLNIVQQLKTFYKIFTKYFASGNLMVRFFKSFRLSSKNKLEKNLLVKSFSDLARQLTNYGLGTTIPAIISAIKQCLKVKNMKALLNLVPQVGVLFMLIIQMVAMVVA
jgi:hypothetical protein